MESPRGGLVLARTPEFGSSEVTVLRNRGLRHIQELANFVRRFAGEGPLEHLNLILCER